MGETPSIDRVLSLVYTGIVISRVEWRVESTLLTTLPILSLERLHEASFK